MTLDLLDAAFLRRWEARDRRPPAAPAAGATAVVSAPPVAADPPTVPPPQAAQPPETIALTSAGDRLEATARRLFERAPEQWLALARHCERARQRGLRVIAVAGAEQGEGRSTLVACLAEALRQRGRDVVCVGPTEVREAGGGPVGGGAAHDRKLVLVDAGIWFPPGPMRRRRLLFSSLGHDAVILVRRADRPSLESRAAILESLGLMVLGEVLTFASPDDGGPGLPEASA